MMPRRSQEWLTPPLLLPSQLPSRHSLSALPELGLMRAVVRDAVDCIARPPHGSNSESEAAYEWIFEDDRSWPFSFLNLCDWLGIDPIAVRESLHRDRAAREVLRGLDGIER